MFRNSGGKIKGLAKLIFILTIVCFAFLSIIELIVAIVFFSAAGRYNQYGLLGGLMIFSMILTLAMGVVVAWLNSIRLYAEGQQVEDIQKLREIVEYRILEKPAAKPESYNYFTDSPINYQNQPLNGAFDFMNNDAPQQQQYQSQPQQQYQNPAKNNTTCCPRCGAPYVQGDVFCRNCGNTLS